MERFELTKKRKQFKNSVVVSFIISLLAIPLAFYSFLLNYPSLSGIISLILALLISWVNIAYIKSRDKMQIIDYFSLKYYIEFNFSLKKFILFIKNHFYTYLIYVVVIILFQIFWILSITQDFYSFTAMGFFTAIVKSQWEYKFDQIKLGALIQSEESDKVMSNCLKRIDQLTFSEVNKKEFAHLKNKMDKEHIIKCKHTQLIKQTSIEFKARWKAIQTLVVEGFGVIVWMVINIWLVSNV